MQTIWELQPSEYHRYTQHLLCLDEVSRYMRFGYPAPNDSIIRLGQHISHNTSLHKIFVVENDDLEVIAAGHVSLEGDKPELAFSVFKEHQGQGLGDLLMTRLLEWCRNRNIREGYMVCLPDNAPIKHLARKHGILVHNEHGEAVADIELPAPTPGSYIKEMVNRNWEIYSHARKCISKMTVYPLTFKQ